MKNLNVHFCFSQFCIIYFIENITLGIDNLELSFSFILKTINVFIQLFCHYDFCNS